MTTLLRAADSAGLLRNVPVLAGFTPRHSIVLLPFRGSRTHGAMRLDLPADTVGVEEYADAAIGLILRVRATDAVALVVYTDEPPQTTRDGLVLPCAIAVEEILGRADDAGLRIVDALCVTPEGWSSYLDEEPLLGPLDDVSPAAGPAGAVDVAEDQFAGADLPRVDLAEKERVGRALRGMADVLDHDRAGRPNGRENPHALAALDALDDIPAFFEALLERPEHLPTFAAAALLWCMERPALRDVALAQWASDHPGGVRTLDAQLAFSHAGAAIPEEIGDVFLGRGPTPDADRLRVALSVVRRAAASAPRLHRRGPLTGAAWLSWALGRSSHAARYLELVRDIDPDYGLAALLGTMIDGAVLPEWAFRRGVVDESAA